MRAKATANRENFVMDPETNKKLASWLRRYSSRPALDKPDAPVETSSTVEDSIAIRVDTRDGVARLMYFTAGVPVGCIGIIPLNELEGYGLKIAREV